MLVRSLLPIALVTATAGLTGCSGGSDAVGSNLATCAGTRVNALCLTNCSLGCRGTRCEITEIAQNENIVLVFNTDVDPRTVNSSTIQFRTASGEEPVGDYLVNRGVVEFVPRILVVGGQSFFGFRAGETYTMTLPGGRNDPNVLRSTSGDPLLSTVSCTVNVSRGIVDLNGVPPRAELVSPTQSTNVSQDVTIQLRFNEAIDVTPFLGTNAANGPIVFALRRTRENTTTGQRECSPTSDPVPMVGSPRVDLDPVDGVSIVTFRPTQPLPGNICCQISVTDRVRDLSGRPAQPQLFQFITVATPPGPPQVIAEPFDNDANLDREASSGTWSGGFADFGLIGGDGRHGTFDATLGVDRGIIAGKQTWEFNTDGTIIPGANTTTGNPIAVTDGRFFFDKMIVPSDIRLRFVGSSPPQFTVSGRLDIAGEIDVRGGSTDLPLVPNTGPAPGQPGGTAGIFGGAGGRGGDRCLGIGTDPAFNGVDGQNARVLAGHAYATSVFGTGGRGSTLFPPRGLNADIVFGSGFLTYTAMAAAGGGGGGHAGPGGPGQVITNSDPAGRGTATGITSNTLTDTTKTWITAPQEWANQRVRIVSGPGTGQERLVQGNTANELTLAQPWDPSHPNGLPVAGQSAYARVMAGDPAPGGSAVTLFPVPAGARSSLHFLVGGAGGGGGASHPALTNSITRIWAQGCGGGGGGGAIALRAGDSLRLATTGSVLARGGSAAQGSGTTTQVTPCPGGGGSGGAVVLQSGRLTAVDGLVDVRGGARGFFDRFAGGAPPVGSAVNCSGGDGGVGFVRLEVPGNPTTSLLPNVQPPATAANVATLTEADPVRMFRSNFYSTGQVFGPDFLRYEIRATVDGTPVVYSDDPRVSNLAARFGQAPIQAQFQGATINPQTGTVDPSDIRPWRLNVGPFANEPSLAEDGRNGFRFMISLDGTSGQAVRIDEVKVYFNL